jgi:hypothetical protein
MNTGKMKMLITVVFFAVTAAVLALSAQANSAEPPSVAVIVNNPPSDFSCKLLLDDSSVPAYTTRSAWEGHYVFYSGSLDSDGDYLLDVIADGESFTVKFPDTPSGYSNIYTLDLGSRTLTGGYYPLRGVMLVSLRVVITLLIEGAVFWLFGYRQKRSWTAFLVVNLITQGLLNIWLNSQGLMLSGYVMLALIIGEMFVFAAELIALPLAVTEHKKLRTALYALAANAVSLAAGGLIIMYLPV